MSNPDASTKYAAVEAGDATMTHVEREAGLGEHVVDVVLVQ